MSKDKICKAMAKDIYALIRSSAMSFALASMLYDKGWRNEEQQRMRVKRELEESDIKIKLWKGGE